MLGILSMLRKPPLHDSMGFKTCGLVRIIGQLTGSGNGETLMLALMVISSSYLEPICNG